MLKLYYSSSSISCILLTLGPPMEQPKPDSSVSQDRINSSTNEQEPLHRSPTFAQEVERLHQLTVYARWLVVMVLWLTIGSWSLWDLRSEIALWIDDFTWIAVYYGLAYHRLANFGLAFCLGMTTAVLIWQSRNILLGRPPKLQNQLEQQVLRIRQQGSSHPLWKWVCKDN